MVGDVVEKFPLEARKFPGKRKNPWKHYVSKDSFGGDKRDRTADLLNAIVNLLTIVNKKFKNSYN